MWFIPDPSLQKTFSPCDCVYKNNYGNSEFSVFSLDELMGCARCWSDSSSEGIAMEFLFAPCQVCHLSLILRRAHFIPGLTWEEFLCGADPPLPPSTVSKAFATAAASPFLLLDRKQKLLKVKVIKELAARNSWSFKHALLPHCLHERQWVMFFTDEFFSLLFLRYGTFEFVFPFRNNTRTHAGVWYNIWKEKISTPSHLCFAAQ